MGFRMLRTAAALVAVVLLAGCVPGDPVITPEPEPDATPVFASDEEALAAATEAYAKYLEVSDQITADGGVNPERLEPYVTPDQFVEELNAFRDLIDSSLRTEGQSQFDVVELQQYSDVGGGAASVTVYLCVDVTNVRVLSDSGTDITPSNRVDKFPLEVEVLVEAGGASAGRVARSAPWSGTNYCG